MSQSNYSDDLLWEIVRNQNAFLVKRKSGGGAQFSRDPFNLTNKHSRTHAGFINSKAVSVQADGEKGITLKTKKVKLVHKPDFANNTNTFGSTTSNRKIYKSTSDSVGKQSYRSDLNQHAVARASAIRNSQRVKKETPASKARGAAAKKATAA